MITNKSRSCDILVIGSGASGALASLVLARAGLDVVCLEQGDWVTRKDRVHESPDWAWRRQDGWNPDVNKRHNDDDYPVESDSSQVLMWNGVGGSTNVYSAVWPRYRPSDFRKGDEHGLQPNWPITYEDVAPYYELADRLLGVSGMAGDPAMPPRERPPTRPLPFTKTAQHLARAFDRLGWHWWPAEAGVISEDYDGRPGCNNCGLCVGCARGSMSLFSHSIWPKALAAGAELRTNARVLRIETGRDGRATGVIWKNRITNVEERIQANVILLGGNGVGTPRLLLSSDNLANSSDMVGRNLMHHAVVGAQIQVEQPLDGHMGWIGSVISREFAETDISRGFVNGINFNCLTSTPSPAELSNGFMAGAKAPWGAAHHKWFEENFNRSITLLAIGDDLPNPENRVYLDSEARDADGIPLTRLHYRPGENDRRMMNFALDRLVDIGKAADAVSIQLTDCRDANGVYRVPAWHMIGTCRMGENPEMSVVNRWNQCWDVPNLFLIDGSVVTSGGVVNPTPTVAALALRAAEYVRDNYVNLTRTTKSAA